MGYPKLMFHALAIVGNTAIWFSVLCILVSYYGNMKQKQAVAGVYLAWAVGAGVIQYTHPWNDDPVSMLDMPMPLLLGIVDRGHGPRARGVGSRPPLYKSYLSG